MISEGDTVTDFSLPGTAGEEINEYELSEYTDSGAVILVLYPFDFSPVCTTELCEFRDANWLSFTENVDVFGISHDACYAHKRFIQEYDLPFPLLSDTRGRLTDRLGLSYDEWEHHEGVPKRALVTIDDTNTVRYTWVTESAYESPSLDELHETVKVIVN
ncbi:redoxin domain-containing protein [Halobacterium wangiae]|uniref:redoxin domain-containing protein n=1 Tax=Halobacterium wangiae TaxID=2902623 RepID=UPI001E6508C3|nr:redoxin domain-containing protein [Halobacterium wangiae]